MTWKVEHAPDCSVTKERADLLAEIAAAEDPMCGAPAGRLAYLRGAVPEYDEGGDQEVENCTCGVYPLVQVWTLLVEVPIGEAPSELIEALHELGVGVREIHFQNLLPKEVA